MRSSLDRRGRIPAPVVVTDAAMDRIALIRGEQHPRPDQSLGLVLEPGGRIGLVLDIPDVGDRVLTRNGEPVLFIAAAVERSLHNHMIDFEGAAGSERFTIQRLRAPDV